MWIGILDDIESMIGDDHLSLLPGDVMLVYTDGITEAWKKGTVKDKRDPAVDMFGEGRLIEILKRLGKETPDAIKNDILDNLKQYDCHDDVTMVILKRIK